MGGAWEAVCPMRHKGHRHKLFQGKIRSGFTAVFLTSKWPVFNGWSSHGLSELGNADSPGPFSLTLKCVRPICPLALSKIVLDSSQIKETSGNPE